MIKRFSAGVFPKPALCPERQPFQTAIIVSMRKAHDEDQSVPTTGYNRICLYSVSVMKKAERKRNVS
jgi:hypothetical protein